MRQCKPFWNHPHMEFGAFLGCMILAWGMALIGATNFHKQPQLTFIMFVMGTFFFVGGCVDLRATKHKIIQARKIKS